MERIQTVSYTHLKTTITYKDLYKDVKPGTIILVDDGALEFEVKEVVGTDIVTVAKNTAKLGSRKTMNIRGVKVNLPALAPKAVSYTHLDVYKRQV